ncbi:SCP2 sterol-binding domain-containing protein [Paracoccus sp. DMF-8]|uniref:SCP2 sterol-binding domain-containing protein n=1 Tax=Paracoccus sp. DMF-8 TaxID=3019445 RepID=UPI0023E461F4|nr:SCP2 sterol-binding domain-containing protein [Paracoccus sp. DMF-8]MDF3608512.1 SCP2 sterol-binding domain-containing protein [Paracoccus sp. DMF-8]
MSKVVDAAVQALSAKIPSFRSSAKFVIKDEGSIVIDSNGVRAGDDETEVTLTADRETFEGLLDGSVNPTMAFMTGKLTVDGSMGVVMKLGAMLS